MARGVYYNLSVRNLVYRLRKFRSIINDGLRECMLNMDVGFFIKSSIQDQTFLGLDGYGRRIEPPYAERTIRRKIRKGQPIDRVTLRDTGAMMSFVRLKVIADEEGFYIWSVPFRGDNAEAYNKKVNAVVNRYGRAIFRINNDTFNALLNIIIRPYLAKKLKETLLDDK